MRQQGVAVRLGLGHQVHGNRAAGTGAVLHNKGLAELRAQALGKGARHDVGGAACGQGDDEAHRLGGPVLRLGAQATQRCSEG